VHTDPGRPLLGPGSVKKPSWIGQGGISAHRSWVPASLDLIHTPQIDKPRGDDNPGDEPSEIEGTRKIGIESR